MDEEVQKLIQFLQGKFNKPEMPKPFMAELREQLERAKREVQRIEAVIRLTEEIGADRVEAFRRLLMGEDPRFKAPEDVLSAEDENLPVV